MTSDAKAILRFLTVHPPEMDIEGLSQIVRCGIHSGIPSCCILFYLMFLFVWDLAFGALEPCNDKGCRVCTEAVPAARRIVRAYNRVVPKKVHYNPCPDCLEERKFVRLLSCDRLKKTGSGIRCELLRK